MGVPLTIQAYREIAIAISRRFLQMPFKLDDDDEDIEFNEDQDVDPSLAAVLDWQAGHTVHVAGMAYARLVTEMSGWMASRRNKYRAVSMVWHQFLGFASAVDAAPGPTSRLKRKQAPFESEADHSMRSRQRQLRSFDFQMKLREWYGDDAAFRGVQQSSLLAIIEGQSPVVPIMPTGGGKSLLYMLPAACSTGGTTIVVIPLISLRDHIKERCDEVGIDCVEWDRHRQADGARVLLVTPEAALHDDGIFISFLNRLKATRQLDRIVIDEAHIILNNQKSFRKKMQQLGKLGRVGVQMILLTATLPPTLEEELWKRMWWKAHEVVLFRESTTRTNISYKVIRRLEARQHSVRHRNESDDEYALRMIRRALRRLDNSGGKVIVYCNDVERVKRLATELQCPGYFHDVHPTTKQQILADLMSGATRAVVATSACGMGIDIPDFRAVIHLGIPYTLLDYAQESGRGGRDGKPAEAAVIIEDADERRWAAADGSISADPYMDAFIGRMSGVGTGAAWYRSCRRIILDDYLDGSSQRNTVGRVSRCAMYAVTIELAAHRLSLTIPARRGDLLQRVKSLAKSNRRPSAPL